MHVVKDKGSYTKIFHDYKERRKLQNHSNKPDSDNYERDSPNKSTENSPMSSNLINLIQEISSERPSSYKYFNESNDFLNQKKAEFLQSNSLEKKASFVDSHTLTDRSSLLQNKQNIPSLNDLDFKSEKNEQNEIVSKDLKLTRYNEYRNVHRTSQRETRSHSLTNHLSNRENKIFREKERFDQENFNNTQNNQDIKKKNPIMNHSQSTGLLKTVLTPINSNRRASYERLQTSRESYNPKKTQRGLRSEEVSKYSKEHFSGVQPVVTCLSTKNSRVTQESLLKSLKLRQEMYSRLFNKVTRSGDDQNLIQNNEYPLVKDFQELLGKEIIFPRQREDEDKIYKKNVKWLMSKQKKIDEMHNKELEEKMKECTFKPQLLTKGFDLNFGLFRAREKTGSFSRNKELK